MAEIKTGWLKDYNGEKFAPITDARQVYFNGTKDENVQDVLSKKPGRLVENEVLNGITAGEGAEIFNDLENNKATGKYSHAEGYGTIASGENSHAEGYEATASGEGSHAENFRTTASGHYSHTEGWCTTASGIYSHAEGCWTIASVNSQHVQGRWNVADTTSAHIVGNGSNDSNRANIHTVDWDGNAWFSGDVYIKSTSGTNKDAGSKKLATEEFVNNNKTNIVIREW